ncbi:uncharacterized protein LOC103317729 [Nasonia vitripennis]|uniref:HTH CENPB-type domain-containing protein n=1 Tax=Nasonia vitripennis TaxID=7425 RepID=A0A7M7HB12_NASVI|nr:uncharacterized protein LOC103317729 [Nasonia vitripennis]
MSTKSKRPRLLYSREALEEAIADIKAGMPVKTASEKYQIPRTTLHNKMTARYADKRPGPETVLTTAEENALVQWIANSSKQGLMVGKQQLVNSVAFLVKTLNRENPFSNGRPGRHWYQSFLRRHKDIVSRINENSGFVKTCADEADIRNWFHELSSYLEQKRLLDIPASRIFAAEMCVLFSMNADDEDREKIYVQMAGSADGCLVPPMLLFDNERLPSKIYQSLPRGWTCSKSDDGCMKPENFYEYVTQHFKKWLVKRKVDFPVVLFVDGKAPYLTLSLSNFCLRNKIQLIGLLPNLSHILQPLNKELFPSVKEAWKKTLEFHLQKEATNSLKEYVAPLLKSVLDDLQIDQLLINGFLTTGLHPLTEDALNYDKVPKKILPKSEIPEFDPYNLNEIFQVEEGEQHLEKCMNVLNHLEQWLSSSKLEIFNEAFDHEKWTGRIEDKSLFYYWRKVKTEVAYLNFEPAKSDTSCETVIVEADVHSSTNESRADIVEIIIEDSEKEYSTEIIES